VKHEIIQIDGNEGTFDNTKVYEVPPGHYFVMGGNHDNWSDSRLAADQGGVGYVPFENLIGKAAFNFKSNDPGSFGAQFDSTAPATVTQARPRASGDPLAGKAEERLRGEIRDLADSRRPPSGGPSMTSRSSVSFIVPRLLARHPRIVA
jgi:hypothetical protein